MRQGWICPKCGWIWSPSTQQCFRCNRQNKTAQTALPDPPVDQGQLGCTYKRDWGTVTVPWAIKQRLDNYPSVQERLLKEMWRRQHETPEMRRDRQVDYMPWEWETPDVAALPTYWAPVPVAKQEADPPVKSNPPQDLPPVKMKD